MGEHGRGLMSKTEPKNVEMTGRRLLVADLYLRRKKPGAIHEEVLQPGFNCNYETVRRDIAALEAQWQKELLTDPVSKRALRLAELEEMESEAAERIKLAKENDQDTVMMLWRDRRLKVKERISKLLGLDAAVQREAPVTPTEAPASEWNDISTALFAALAPFPGAKEAVAAALNGHAK